MRQSGGHASSELDDSSLRHLSGEAINRSILPGRQYWHATNRLTGEDPQPTDIRYVGKLNDNMIT